MKSLKKLKTSPRPIIHIEQDECRIKARQEVRDLEKPTKSGAATHRLDVVGIVKGSGRMMIRLCWRC